ncbi:TetR/AcrR family transcriptional regulator [Clostridium sp. MB40-C1]|uniref:TetR/AcrR family transcriptional regulator n=1 Tax=Clostridium sp. MB40-C1 TaxID=3070996 RepID=UPI0027E0126D|nr:TetR/AcrR family transcriptional regulator [Clostridium sp. MB40-C1]WMJ81562.1 TetR/AcrR family transcriptional regulator [Clostridium sp. MB40-C1]
MQDLTETQKKLLEVGKREFLEKGFKNASLRDIVKKAGFTLGAFYGYYPNKEALFCALVEKPAQELLNYYFSMCEKFKELPILEQIKQLGDVPKEGMHWSIEHIYDNFDAFKLVLCCSSGTKYESYIDKIVEVETASTYSFIDRIKSESENYLHIDEDLVHILSNSMFSGMFEIVVHDMPKSRAKEYVHTLHEFFVAGWQKILRL